MAPAVGTSAYLTTRWVFGGKLGVRERIRPDTERPRMLAWAFWGFRDPPCPQQLVKLEAHHFSEDFRGNTKQSMILSRPLVPKLKVHQVSRSIWILGPRTQSMRNAPTGSAGHEIGNPRTRTSIEHGVFLVRGVLFGPDDDGLRILKKTDGHCLYI